MLQAKKITLLVFFLSMTSVFGKSGKNFLKKEKREFKRFITFYNEGINLNRRCQNQRPMRYFFPQDKKTVETSMVATLQYLGLDLTIKGIASYAKFFELSKEEFKNMTGKLIKNTCSKNISVVGHKKIDFLFNREFKSSSVYFPNKDKFYPSKTFELNGVRQAKKQELAWTVELFKTFCGWGGGEKYKMSILLRDPMIYAFLIRKVMGRKISWNAKKNDFSLTEDKDSIKIYCKGRLCRRVDARVFQKKFPMPLREDSMARSLEALYCQKFRHGPKDPRSLMPNQLTALITGWPDLLVRARSFDQLKKMLRGSLDTFWDLWAERENKRFDKHLDYEGPLRIELVDRKFYFDPLDSIFRIKFDLNMGEFDRANILKGKLEASFELHLSNHLLAWGKRHGKGTKKERESVSRTFQKTLSPQVARAREFWHTPPGGGILKI